MPIQLTPLRGEEFIRKVLHGDRYFIAVRLEEGFDFTKAEEYGTLRCYLEKNSHRKLEVTDSEFRYIRAPDLMLVRLQGERANFEGSYLVGGEFGNAELEQACFRDADLTGADFSGARLTRAVLEKATLADCCLDEADLTEAKLQKARLHRVNLNEANLARTDLRNVRGLEYCYNVESAGFDETIISPRELDVLRRLLEKKRFVVRD